MATLRTGTMDRRRSGAEAGADLVAATIGRAGQALGRFALVLDGDKLAPRYRDGDMLMVDAAAIPATGDAVIIETADRFGCMIVNADGDGIDYRGGFIPRGGFRVVGVVYDCIPAVIAVAGTETAQEATDGAESEQASIPPPAMPATPGRATPLLRRYIRRAIH